MKVINHLIILADRLDVLNMKKVANSVDELISGIYTKTSNISIPVMRNLTNIPGQFEVVSPLENKAEDIWLDDAQRYYQLMKLKRTLNELQKQKKELDEDELDEEFEDESNEASDAPIPVRHMMCDYCGTRRRFHYNRKDGWVCSYCEKVAENYADDTEEELLEKKMKEDQSGTLDKVIKFFRENPELLAKLLMYLV